MSQPASCRPSLEECGRVLAEVLGQDGAPESDNKPMLWPGDEPLICFHDLDRLTARMDDVSSAFPNGENTSVLHTSAVKANPVISVLSHLVAGGFGLECASWGEVELSLAAGCSPDRILFDSPAKSVVELREALERGVHLNVDNVDELARIAECLEHHPEIRPGRVGLRINPQVGEGSIAMTSVAGSESKFGVPLSERAAIHEAFETYLFLDGIHVHVGSQGVALDALVDAAAVTRTLVDELNARRDGAVTWVDLGGGLPVRYTESDDPFELSDYTEALRSVWPELGTELMLLTEFGRWLHANVGYTAARVEYVKASSNGAMMVTHAGADLFMRPVYQPDTWRHEYGLVSERGVPKSSGSGPTKLAGPLCFGGDFLDRDTVLPAAVPGDWLIVFDTGAYTLSMWSRHCNRTMPPVVGISHGQLVLLKRPESIRQLTELWT